MDEKVKIIIRSFCDRRSNITNTICQVSR